MRRPRNGKVLKSFWRQNAPSIMHPLIMCICISCSIYPSLHPPVAMCVCVWGCHCVACLSAPRGASIKISYHYRKGNRHPKLGSKSGPPHGDKARQMDRVLTGIHKQSAPTSALYYPHTLPRLLLSLLLQRALTAHVSWQRTLRGACNALPTAARLLQIDVAKLTVFALKTRIYGRQAT